MEPEINTEVPDDSIAMINEAEKEAIAEVMDKAPQGFDDPREYAKEKIKVLYQARHVLSKLGTMPERQVVRKQLKKMKKELGLD